MRFFDCVFELFGIVEFDNLSLFRFIWEDWRLWDFVTASGRKKCVVLLVKFMQFATGIYFILFCWFYFMSLFFNGQIKFEFWGLRNFQNGGIILHFEVYFWFKIHKTKEFTTFLKVSFFKKVASIRWNIQNFAF